ncbi:hypothetical protein [Micromonospora sp. WMMD714]|uniref:hypothetical protein n=1 Tax=Micromonospora sp. WMMD714 TaxID=3016097 RepID=UPI00249CD5B3|nr:hypothetical protein [Micromonospora sp. WMMD714]
MQGDRGDLFTTVEGGGVEGEAHAGGVVVGGVGGRAGQRQADSGAGATGQDGAASDGR